MQSGLALNFLAISWDHVECDVCMGRTGDHVLEAIAVTAGINDGVVPRLRVELLLLKIHVEGKGERSLPKRSASCFNFSSR